jgi:hypothetical protein
MIPHKNVVDFFGASHGHFVDYVLNVWIYQGHRVPKVFTDLGTSHVPFKDQNYHGSRQIFQGHYTESNLGHFTPKKIVRISIDQDWAKWIYQINVMCRVADIPLEESIKLIDTEVRQQPRMLRNQWYSKFIDDSHAHTYPGNWRWQSIPAFDFGMEKLYDLYNFYNTMYNCAEYLGMRFCPDIELAQLWQEFIQRNQGWQIYTKCKTIVDQVLSGIDAPITTNEIEQALINAMLSKTVYIFDGPLFEENQYPNSTAEIWDKIQQHLVAFDQRF